MTDPRPPTTDHRRRVNRWPVGILVAVGVVLQAVGQVSAEATDQRFVDGLLARRLFLLAETYCQDALAAEDLAARRRAELTVELSRTYVEQARQSAPDERAAVWQKAQEVLDARTELDGQPYAALSRRQLALVHLARGDLARQEAEVVAQPESLLQEARDQLLAAVTTLGPLQQDLAQQLVRRHRAQEVDDETLSVDELRLLQEDVRHQLGRALQRQALCYPPGSADRTHAVARAVEQFRDAAQRNEPIDWNSRLELLACYRGLHEATEFERLMRTCRESAPPPTVAAQLRLEEARWLLDRGQAEQVLSALDKQPALPPGDAAQWDYTRLVALLAAWKADRDAGQDDAWAARAAAQISGIEAAHGPYWMRRAEGLMARHVALADGTGDVDILARAAASYFRTGNRADALAAYDRAAAAALRAGHTDKAFELGFLAASIEHQQKRHAAARDRFRELADRFEQHPRAAEAHLMAVLHEAELLRAGGSADIAAYESLLNDHLTRWPTSATADRAAWWLAEIYRSRRKWPSAIQHYQRVGTGSERYVPAIRAVADCYEKWLAETDSRDPVFSQLSGQAVEYFARLAGSTPAGTDRAQHASAVAAVLAARFRMRYLFRDFQATERSLSEILVDDGLPPGTWRDQAQLYLVLALAGQAGRSAEAVRQLELLEGASSENWIELSRGISGLIQRATPVVRRSLAELQVRVARRARAKAEDLSAEDGRQLDLAVASALVIGQRRNEALAAYKSLAAAYPEDGATQVAYAGLLLDGKDQASWRAALDKWREVERKSRPKSQRWFEAKYSQALAHVRLGNPRQAERIISLTQALHPDLGGPDMKVRFLELLRRCQAAP